MTSDFFRAEKIMDQSRLQELLDEATVDCYDEEEEFSGVLCTLDDNLKFPLQATVLGEMVEVVGLDESRSGLRHGIIAKVRKRQQEYRAALSELEFTNPDSTSAKWLAMWQREGAVNVTHYAFEQEVPLRYDYHLPGFVISSRYRLQHGC
jgi:hypothetical protein